METYLVGGAVRDQLLNLPVTERDWVVVGATPADMINAGFKPVGKEFPVFLHPQTKEEYALARTERKVGPGYKGFECHTGPDITLEMDLARRDLTINAIAQTAQGVLVDPFSGQADLQNGVLRHVSEAFTEDPVRVLRLARFAARFAPWGFHVAHSTQKLLRQMVSAGEVDHLTPERIWKEFERAFAAPNPERFIEVLSSCDALAGIFPEMIHYQLPSGHNKSANDDAHAQGLFARKVLKAVTASTTDVETRLAAFLFHLCQPAATPTNWLAPDAATRDCNAEQVTHLLSRLRAPASTQALARLVATYQTNCHQVETLASSQKLDLLLAIDALRRPQRVAPFLTACEALFVASQTEEKAYTPAASVQGYLNKISAIDIAALSNSGLSGKALGSAIRAARIEALD